MSGQAKMLRRLGAIFVALVLSGPVRAGYREGLEAFQGGAYADAFVEWRVAAAEGDVAAKYRLGRLYQEGLGIRRSLVQAYAWYNLAAARGHREARSARDALSASLSREQLARGQALTLKIASRSPAQGSPAAVAGAPAPPLGVARFDGRWKWRTSLDGACGPMRFDDLVIRKGAATTRGRHPLTGFFALDGSVGEDGAASLTGYARAHVITVTGRLTEAVGRGEITVSGVAFCNGVWKAAKPGGD